MPRLSLSEIAERLEKSIERTEESLKRQADAVGLDPIDMQDPNGRFILLDAYVQLAQIRLIEEQQKPSIIINNPHGV